MLVTFAVERSSRLIAGVVAHPVGSAFASSRTSTISSTFDQLSEPVTVLNPERFSMPVGCVPPEPVIAATSSALASDDAKSNRISCSMSGLD